MQEVPLDAVAVKSGEAIEFERASVCCVEVGEAARGAAILWKWIRKIVDIQAGSVERGSVYNERNWWAVHALSRELVMEQFAVVRGGMVRWTLLRGRERLDFSVRDLGDRLNARAFVPHVPPKCPLSFE